MARNKAKRQAVHVDQMTTAYWGDFQKAIDQASSPGDCVRVVGSIVDNSVLTLLGSVFVKDEISDRILDIQGHLHTASSCTDMAFCLGFITKPVWKNLKQISRVRNLFAHSEIMRDFTDDEVVKLCKGLTFPKLKEMVAGNMKIPQQMADMQNDQMDFEIALSQSQSTTPARDRFVLVATLTAVHIVTVAATTARCTTRQGPMIW